MKGHPDNWSIAFTRIRSAVAEASNAGTVSNLTFSNISSLLISWGGDKYKKKSAAKKC